MKLLAKYNILYIVVKQTHTAFSLSSRSTSSLRYLCWIASTKSNCAIPSSDRWPDGRRPSTQQWTGQLFVFTSSGSSQPVVVGGSGENESADQINNRCYLVLSPYHPTERTQHARRSTHLLLAIGFRVRDTNITTAFWRYSYTLLCLMISIVHSL